MLALIGINAADRPGANGDPGAALLFCQRAFALVATGLVTMHRIELLFFGCALSAAAACVADGTAAQSQAARIRVETAQVEVQPDGSDVITQHVEMLVLNKGAATTLGQFPISYNEGTTDVDITDAYTLKPDGQKITLDAASIITQQPPNNSPLAALFTDAKQKVLIFPNVQVGDTLVFTEKRRNKQLYFPGQFVRQGDFLPTVPVDDSTLSIIAPKTLALNMETHEVEFHKSEDGDRTIYTLHYANPTPQSEQGSLIANLDHLPRYFVSSFKSYDELAHAYAGLISAKIVVTPKIQAQAEAITSGITGRREKAQAIYEWVSRHVRYVAIIFGNGALVPHDADAVLSNAYGDCKDHVVLFSALLKAVGIDSVPALINATNGYTVSKVPALGQFNHVIAWLPEFKLYADTTANYLPFGTLALNEYGKPVLLTGATLVGLRQIPLSSADAATISFKSVLSLDDQRLATAESTTTATGPFAAQLRNLGTIAQNAGPERFASDMLTKQGKPLATGTFDVGNPDGFASTYSISSKYSTPRPLQFGGMPFGLRLLPVTGDLLLGPIGNTKIKDSDPTPCYNGHSTEDLTLNLPANAHVASLPPDTRIDEGQFRYSSHWSLSGQTVSVHREMITNLSKPLCTDDLRQKAASALTAIRKDHEALLPISYGVQQHPVLSLQAGQLSEVNSHSRWGQGREWPITIKVTNPPAHGKVTVETAQGLVRTAGGQPQSHALTRVLYQSETGFAGKDSFTYERSSQDPSDPLNGHSVTIDVDVK